VTALRVAYVLGTTAGGTGRHAAMLAAGCLRAGLAVSAFGPEETRRLFTPDVADGVAADVAGRSADGVVADVAGRSADGVAADVAGRSADGVAGRCAADVAGCLPPSQRQQAVRRAAAAVSFEPVEIADRPRPARDAAAVARLRGLLARAAPDVVHAHGLRAGAAAALALAGDRARAPALIVTVHNGPPAAVLSALAYRALERAVARRADAVLCVSGDLADRMRRLGVRDAGPAVVAAPEVAVPSAGAIRQARADIAADGRPVVLAVGRLTSQKGFGTLLDAAARWQGRVPRPQLAIAGDGPLSADLARKSDAAGLAVRFLGHRCDIPALLAVADVVAVPSRWEGQPMVVQEALRAGRPIVACRVGGVPDLTGGDAALLVQPGAPAELAAAVLRVLDDRDLARRLGAAALARAAVLPSAADAVQAGLAVYSRLAAARPGAGRPSRSAQRRR
jgi:glycosyltransferase involved in cell wall biosynthesis